MANLTVPISAAVKDMTLTVTVTGVRVWKVRMWCGLQLVKLAARVIGCGFRVDL